MERVFAIGDIHGCSKTFEAMLFDKIKIQKSDQIFCIGDYIDRGKDSKGVIDIILELKAEGFSIYTLRGNHEQMMLDAFTDDEAMDLWLSNSGAATLKSFGIKSLSDLPALYSSFLTETEFYLKKDNYIFAHAGLNFENENIFEDKDAMLWIRYFERYQPSLGNQLLIHGHTPEPLDHILNQAGNCINIDGGCVYKHRRDFGNLVAIDANERKFITVHNCE